MFSQTRIPKSQSDSHPASFAIRGGFTKLFGDLNEPLTGGFGGALLILPVYKTVSIETPVETGTLLAQQKEYYNSSAKTRFIQAALTASVDVLDWFKEERSLHEIRPYVGAGLLFFRAEARDLTTGRVQRVTNNQGSHRSRDGIEARGKAGVKRTHELVYVLGLRGSTALARRVSIFCDVRFNIVRTDKLDATLDNNNGVMQATGPAFTEGNHYGTNSHDKWGYIAGGLNFYFGERFKKK
ncbi:hypothetical protein ACO2Q8_18050 [Larkinella sp. VNQ87]|uniref:hypothetical protein n=1 Tax=Larkinella sp. VNQ87 TaxID=3400921 RepID=UPI003BFF5B5F